MRKLIVLMLVLGMASLANATPYVGGLLFTVDGVEQPDVITLAPSEAVSLDLHLLAGFTMDGYTLDYVLSNAQAELIITGGYGYNPISYPADPLFDFDGTEPIVTPQMVQITSSQMFSPAINGPQDLMVDLLIHCLDTTPVTLTIISQAGTKINGENIDSGTVLHTLGIVQIPEPMTIALLGLGGLFLRRLR